MGIRNGQVHHPVGSWSWVWFFPNSRDSLLICVATCPRSWLTWHWRPSSVLSGLCSIFMERPSEDGPRTAKFTRRKVSGWLQYELQLEWAASRAPNLAAGIDTHFQSEKRRHLVNWTQYIALCFFWTFSFTCIGKQYITLRKRWPVATTTERATNIYSALNKTSLLIIISNVRAEVI